MNRPLAASHARASSRLARIVVASVALAAGAASIGLAPMFAEPTDAPVDRLVANLTARAKKSPRDGHVYYVLGRAHSVAYIMKTKFVSYYQREDGLPSITDDDMQGWRSRSKSNDPPTQAEQIKHLREGVVSFERALELGDDPGPAHLGLAYLLNSGAAAAGDVDMLPYADWALGKKLPEPKPEKSGKNDKVDHSDKVKKPDKAAQPDNTAHPEKAKIAALIEKLGDKDNSVREKAAKELDAMLVLAAPALHAARNDANENRKAAVRTLLSTYWRRIAADHYYFAFEATIKKDAAREQQPPFGGLRELISYEAGKSFQKLAETDPVIAKKDEARPKAIAEGLKKLEALPKDMVITPVVFSLSDSSSLSELLAPQTTSTFDLDGTGRDQAWPWLRPDTALLVWDPSNTGVITSGRQLFGSVTWWMFFRNGYEALDALDDNADGTLSGRELRGIAAWFDRNSNGESDPGEVVSLASLGITSISVQVTGHDGRAPMNHAGITLASGQTLPTYDWIVSPLSTSPAPTPLPIARR
ncbi:MAG: hypothetical protein U0638_11540 [Phycisphaerales bacterium]